MPSSILPLSRAVIAALEEARKTSSSRANAPEETGVLATDYRAFRPPESQAHGRGGEDWADGPAKYLLTSDERKSFQNLADPLSRSEFHQRFLEGTRFEARDSRERVSGGVREARAFCDSDSRRTRCVGA